MFHIEVWLDEQKEVEIQLPVVVNLSNQVISQYTGGAKK
jgi:hypothetical protein